MEVEIGMAHMEKNYWTMYFNDSSTETISGARVVIESPQGQRWQFAFQLDFKCTNNQAEYEALIIGLEILKEMKVTRVLVYGDSQLVIKLVHSTPYYPQSNGRAEANNKVIKGILEKMIKEKPRAWHDLLPETLWAY
ncbi:hypothetical protein CerSpe_071500 [Prunus speciosa]